MLPQASPGILFQLLPDGAVLLDTGSEVYFGLNPVGARIWQLLPPASPSLAALCDALAAEYPDAPPALLRRDVESLLAQLAAEGLVTAEAPADALAGSVA
jgi:hypothetical protein